MTAHVTRYAPTPAAWPAHLRLRIAVLTDIHASAPWTNQDHIAAFCRQANALAPDIVLLLGDYASGPHIGRDLPAGLWAGALSELAAPLGVHAVLGNHDYDGYRRADLANGPTRVEQALAGVGISVYVNRAIRIAHGRGGFWLAGLGDQYAFSPRLPRDYGRRHGLDDLAGTLAQVSTDEPIVLMAHEPDIFPQVPARVALTLSGHTHGGQVKLFGRTPVVPSRYGSRYVYGQIVEDERHLIVSSGLGYSGWPIRVGTRSEIVLIELGKEPPK